MRIGCQCWQKYTVEAKFYDVGEHDESSDDHGHDHDGDHEEEGEDITPEIIEEADVHHVFFEMVGLSNLTLSFYLCCSF